MRDTLRVQFIHGLESNAQGTKSVFLRAHFDATTPEMDTKDMEGSLRTQVDALETVRPDVVVGSSFGGALAVAMLDRGAWRGPTVLLAPAARRLGVVNRLPEGVAVTVVHAKDDDLIPREDSVELAATGTPGLVTFVEVDDGHRLQTLVDSGRLADIVRETARRGAKP